MNFNIHVYYQPDMDEIFPTLSATIISNLIFWYGQLLTLNLSTNPSTNNSINQSLSFSCQGGLETEEDYPYCAGGGGAKGTCYICPAPGYNKTLCGPPVTWCLKNESCEAKVDRSKFMAGLQVAGWKAISEVYINQLSHVPHRKKKRL